ncbi:MAG TPA: hypothetical protein VL137_02850 [Polyangiaceae bacterium]|nr:hypothetical protein [Polyangiaceae bacterium]
MSVYSTGSTQRVARLEQLLERVRHNAALPRARAASAVVELRSVPGSEYGIDEDLVDVEVEVVEIDVDESAPPPVPAFHAVQSARGPDDFSDLNSELPDGVMPLNDGAEHLPVGRVESSSPPRGMPSVPAGELEIEPGGMMFGEEAAIPLQTKRDSQRPTMESEPTAPTMEQMGATIGLEAGSGPGPELELDMPPLAADEASDLELSLPSRGFAGAYTDDLAPPPSAQEDLASFDQGRPNFANELTADQSAQPGHVEHSAGTSLSPLVVERSALSPTVPVAEIIDNRPREAGSFVSLLDSSLSLSKS